MIWLLRHLKPDFKTIADFRRDNRNAFRQDLRRVVLLCRELDLFGRELLAVDGTRIKAVNNKNRNFTRATLTQFIQAADAKLDDYLQRLDKSDTAPSAAPVARGSRTSPEDCRDPATARAAQTCWRNWIGPVRARYRSPIPTAARWRRTPMWRSATMCKSPSTQSTS